MLLKGAPACTLQESIKPLKSDEMYVKRVSKKEKNDALYTLGHKRGLQSKTMLQASSQDCVSVCCASSDLACAGTALKHMQREVAGAGDNQKTFAGLSSADWAMKAETAA